MILGTNWTLSTVHQKLSSLQTTLPAVNDDNIHELILTQNEWLITYMYYDYEVYFACTNILILDTKYPLTC